MSAERVETSLPSPLSHLGMEIADIPLEMWIRWGILVVAWLAVVFWHRHQNKSFRHYILSHNLRSALSDRLNQLAYNRSMEVLALGFFLVTGLVFYDLRYHRLEREASGMEIRLAEAEQAVNAYQSRMHTQANALAEAQRLAGMNEEQQRELDILKPRYENLFINHHVLKRCNFSAPEEFHIINSALAYELNRLNAPAKMRQNIMLAAKGSYDELYAEMSCDSPDIVPMRAQMQAYLQSVITNMQEE